MYEAFFGLLQRPFAAVPSVQSYYPAEVIEQSRVSLLRTIERAEGIGLIIGPAGTGKSLLCQMIAQQLRGDYSLVMLSSARLCTRRALLQNMLFELKLPFRDMEEGELRLSLVDHLQPGERCPHGMLLIIDEAHTLPLRILEEVRLITNLVCDNKPRVRLILSGSAQLEERLASPRLESFNQRITTRCYLHALGQLETASYVQHQIQQAGGRADTIFGDDAYHALYLATDGIPRLVNQVCDHVLMLAYAGGRRRIDARGVEEAWADLQRLPAPWTGDANSSEGIIEFGHLEEAEHDSSDDAFGPHEPAFVEPSLDDVAETTSITGGVGVDAEYAHSGLDAFGENDQPDTGVVLAGSNEEEIVSDHAAAPVTIARDPFGGMFADEEIVLDHFRSWDERVADALPRVSGIESRELAAALANRKPLASSPLEPDQITADEATNAAELEVRLVSTVEGLIDTVNEVGFSTEDYLTPQVQTVIPHFDADLVAPQQLVQQQALDQLIGTRVQCWTPGVTAGESRAIAGPAAQPYRPLDCLETDDRDIIVVEDDRVPHLSLTSSSARATRQEYRRLFGQLRRR